MKKNLYQLLLVSAAITYASLSYAAQPFPGLQKLMNQTELRKTGVNKLSRDELDALNTWLSQYLAGNKNNTGDTTAATRGEDSGRHTGRKTKHQPELIVSRIDGDFNGWSKNTIFHLKNGQVWQQRYDANLHYRAVSPKVEIRKDFFGFYLLHIVGTSFKVGVRRIK